MLKIFTGFSSENETKSADENLRNVTEHISLSLFRSFCPIPLKNPEKIIICSTQSQKYILKMANFKGLQCRSKKYLIGAMFSSKI